MFLTASNRSERPTGKLLEPDEPLPLSCYCKQKKKTTKTTSQIRSIALIFFLLACLYWLYKVYTNATGGFGHNTGRTTESRSKLKLINVFNRHGDRSPSDSLPPGDEFNQRPKFFWPNGLANLTDSGKFRQFRIGLELRKRYEDLLDYNASHYLAFSSPIYRCQESLDHTLRGLFDIDWPLSRGLKLIKDYNADINGNKQCLQAKLESSSSPTCRQFKHLILPSGSGTPLEYERIKIDTATIPTLTYQYLNKCKYRIDHPSPVDTNLSASESVAQLKGIGELEKILLDNYATGWEFDALGLYSTISSEIRLARTRETINYGHKNFEWATQVVPEYGSSGITFFDLYEQAAVLGYRDRIVGTADYIQLGPLISSMIYSQQVALGDGTSNKELASDNQSFDSFNLYRGKKVVFYSTHDSILQLLLHRIGFIRANDGDYETRFNNWHEASDVDQFQAGFRMSKFGMSLVFELYETEATLKSDQADDNAKFGYVQASLYNQEDGKYSPIEYRKLEMGKLCESLFQEQNPTKTGFDMEKIFYDEEVFPLDRTFSCPFELFKNVTSHYKIDLPQLNKLCQT